MDIVGNPDDSADIDWGDGDVEQANSSLPCGDWSMFDLLVNLLATTGLGRAKR